MPRLFSGTLRDNLLMGLNGDMTTSEDRLQAALYQAVLDRDVPMLDHGLETVVGRAGCA